MRQADQQAIREEPIASIDLMERAAQCCSELDRPLLPVGQPARVRHLCGPGKTGGATDTGSEFQVAPPSMGGTRPRGKPQAKPCCGSANSCR